jgi:hypothetical protein
MSWKLERDSLIAETLAFVESVTGKREKPGRPDAAFVHPPQPKVSWSPQPSRATWYFQRPPKRGKGHRAHRLSPPRSGRSRQARWLPKSAPVSQASARIRSASIGSGRNISPPRWRGSGPLSRMGGRHCPTTKAARKTHTPARHWPRRPSTTRRPA